MSRPKYREKKTLICVSSKVSARYVNCTYGIVNDSNVQLGRLPSNQQAVHSGPVPRFKSKKIYIQDGI